MAASVILEGCKFLLYRDDGTDQVAEQLAEVGANADPTFVSGTGGNWVLGDTYAVDGFQHLLLFHRPSRLFVPLAKLKTTAPDNKIRFGHLRELGISSGPPAALLAVDGRRKHGF